MVFQLDTADLPVPAECWLLRERSPPDGPLRLREPYRRFACRKCGKVDELAALTAGIVPDFRPPPDLEAVTTGDQFLIVTRQVLDTLRSVPGVDVQAFPIPAAPDRVVLFPARQFRPPPDARVYTPIQPPEPGDAFQVRGRKCPRCDRLRNTTFRLEWLAIPEDVVLAAAMVEIGEWVSPTWIASQAVAVAIRTAGVTGWRIRPVRAV